MARRHPRTRIVPTQPDEHLGALFLDTELWPRAYTVPYLGYRGAVERRAILAPGLLVGAAALVIFHHRLKPS